MKEGETKIYLSPFIVKYLKTERGSEEYIEEMLEVALNILGEQGDFPTHIPTLDLVRWEDDGVILGPLKMKDFFDKTQKTKPTRRQEVYSLLTMLNRHNLERFVRYLEEDLLERAFNGPPGQS
jgi:hypothetical protein